MNSTASYTYIPFDGEHFFAVTVLPHKHGQYPTVIVRSPYVGALTDRPEEEIAEEYRTHYAAFAQRGYAVVIQHCRGQGKSSGAFERYHKNTVVTLHFSFDGIAFLLQKGECLRVDITATDDSTYVCHTNCAGPYHEQTDTTVAHNTVFLENSYLQLPIEKDV